MVYRAELTAHFEWLEGSSCYEEVLDEALTAIAFVARGRDDELVEYGAAWMTAGGVVGAFGLEELAEKARQDLGALAPAHLGRLSDG